MESRRDKAERFRRMHCRGAPLALPNPWDAGSARMLAALGARALATTSSGFAFARGVADGGNISRDAMLAHAAEVAAAVAVPVSADLENGYGEAPATAAETVRLAAAAGLAGCSLEDTALPGEDAYPFDLAVERIRAAAEVAREIGIVLTARADGMMTGAYDLDEAIRRLRAFEAAGAEVLYAPMPPDWTGLERICAAVAGPVNALAAGEFARRSMADYARAGVARVSVGGGLARLTQALLRDAGREILTGDFSRLTGGISEKEANQMLRLGAGGSGKNVL